MPNMPDRTRPHSFVSFLTFVVPPAFFQERLLNHEGHEGHKELPRPTTEKGSPAAGVEPSRFAVRCLLNTMFAEHGDPSATAPLANPRRANPGEQKTSQERAMNDPMGAMSPALRGRRAKPLAACGVVVFVALALYGALLPATRATALVETQRRSLLPRSRRRMPFLTRSMPASVRRRFTNLTARKNLAGRICPCEWCRGMVFAWGT